MTGPGGMDEGVPDVMDVVLAGEVRAVPLLRLRREWFCSVFEVDEGLLRRDWLLIRDAQDALWGEPWTRIAEGCEFEVRLVIPEAAAEPVVVMSGWCVMCDVPLLPEVPHHIAKGWGGPGPRVCVEAGGSMSARAERVIASEWCGTMALIQPMSSTVAWLRSRNTPPASRSRLAVTTAMFALRLLYMFSIQAIMTRPMAPPMVSAMKTRLSLNMTWSHRHVPTYITAYITTIAVPIIAAKRRYIERMCLPS
jgi:hypothetical protein